MPEPAPQVFRRYRPGTYPATVETICLTDGRSVRTDLVRLNPNVDCYSLDLHGAAPPRVAHYTVTPWARASDLAPVAHDVATILGASYPAVGLCELSARVRAEGYPLGTANLQPHEAIAATQAALWHVTNGVQLDTRPLATPVAVAVHQQGQADPVTLSAESTAWMGTVTRDRAVHLHLTLANPTQLGSYALSFASRSHLDGLRVHLERSPDGRAWTPVASSTVRRASAHVHKVLGVGATLADGRGRGYAHYRIVITTESSIESRIGIEQVRLTPAGGPAYPNPDRVVHLYTYLVCRLPPQPAFGRQASGYLADAASQGDAIVGRIRLRGVAPGLRFRLRALDPGAYVLDEAGAPVLRPVTSTEPLFLRLPRTRATSPARMAVTLPHRAVPQPQLLLGSRTPGAPPQFTPLVRLLCATGETTSTFLLDVTSMATRLERVD